MGYRFEGIYHFRFQGFIAHWLFSEQVVYNVGLCICLYDITKLEDSYIFPGDGASHTKGLLQLFLSCVVLRVLPGL